MMNSILRKVSIKDRLNRSFVWTTTLALSLLMLSLVLIFWLGQNALQVSKVNAPTVHYSEKLLGSIYESELSLLNWITLSDENKKNTREAIWKEDIIPSLNELKKLSTNWAETDQQLVLQTEKLIHILRTSQRNAADIMIKSRDNRALGASEANNIIEREIAPVIEQISNNISLLNAPQLNQMESKASSVKILNWISIVGILVFMALLGIYSYRNLKKLVEAIVMPTNDLVNAVQNIKNGDYSKRVEVASNDEIGLLSSSFNHMAESFQEITHVAKSVSEGDFTHSLETKNENDSLSSSINRMNRKLVEIKNQAQKVADGDFTVDYVPANEQDELGIALQQMTINLRENAALLAQNEAQSKAVINSAADAIITMDEDRNIESFNQAAVQLFQYSSKEILGKNIDILLSNEKDTNGDSISKVWGKKKDGTLIPIHLSIAETRVNDKVILTGILRDLSEESKQQEELAKRTEEIEKQNWIKTAISQVYEVTKGVQDVEVLTTILSGTISKLLGASVGTFYLSERLFAAESDELKLSGSYAFKNTNNLPNSFKFGEGLVGQCAFEGEPIYISDIPEDYLDINSSSGKTKPKEISIIPIKHNREIIGVMEFGTLTTFTEVQQEFIQEIRSSIGIIIKGIVERAKTEELSIEVNNQILAINRSNAAIEFDLEGNILTANNLFLNLMGYTLEEVKGKHHKIFVENSYANSQEYKDFWRGFKDGSFKQGEFERKGKDGKPVWIQGSYNPLLDVDGRPYKVLKVAVDITPQKEQQIKTEELSIEVNNQISAINRSNAAIEFDLDGNVLTANDLFLNLMGYSLEEIKGKHHKIFVGEAYSESEEYKNFWTGFKDGAFKQGEFERRRKDRKPVWIQGSYNPILDTEGKPYKVLKIAVDITEQKEIQFEVQKQKEIVEAQEEELRVSNEELTKQANQLQASEEELRQQQQELEKVNVMLEEKAQLLEEEHKSTVEKNAALEQAQTALVIKTEELEKSGKYKSEFLANMSHELRTPLNSVIILSKLLQDNKTSNLTDKQIEFAQIINKSGEDLLSLINEVLDLAKVESGKIELEIEPQDLRAYADDSRKTFIAIAQDKNVEFVLNVDDSLPEAFITDKQRLNQVVKNLLSNAFKFTDAGGTVSLEFKNSRTLPKFTSPTLLKQENVLQISVSDTGIGIAADKLESVFEAFVQEDGTTQRKYGGTGLGLSISKELVKLLGGEIFVESEVGKGSTFTLFLPFDSSGVNSNNFVVEKVNTEETKVSAEKSQDELEIVEIIKEDKTDTNQKSPAKKLEAVVADDRDSIQEGDNVLLVVEDDLQFAKVLLDQARENGFKVLVTDQGDKALQHVETYSPNAIILDMQLPVMDGWTVLKTLKASEEFAHIPVHVMSGVDKTKLGLELGAVEYLVKPIALDKLELTFSNISKTISGTGMKKVLIIEDDDLNNLALQEMIKSKQLEAIPARNAQDAREKFTNEHPDLVVLDLGLPDVDGIELLGELKTQKKEVPVIVFTGRELSKEELKQIERHKDTSVVLKTTKSYDRLSEETELFLNMLNSTQTDYEVLPPKEFNSGDIIKGKRILIVDDDMRNIYALETILEEEQVEVTVATNGAEAVDEVKNGEFDAVLMDIMMPVMDGYEATQKIRNLGHKDLPIIALTANAMKGDREKCLEAGVSDYMSKPLDVEKLLSLLRVWLYK